MRSQQMAITRFMVRNKAKNLAKKLQYISMYPSVSECKWSEKWLDRVMRQYNLSNHHCTTMAQKPPEDLERTLQYF